MKKTVIKSILAIFLVAICQLSCNDNDDITTPPPPPMLEDSFLYAEGGATSMSSVTTPYANATSNTIFAVNSGSTVIEINLSSLAEGTYTLDDTNHFTYLKPGTSIIWTGVTGTVTITNNLTNKLTGSFNINSGDGSPTINEVNGTFTNIVVNP